MLRPGIGIFPFIATYPIGQLFISVNEGAFHEKVEAPAGTAAGGNDRGDFQRISNLRGK